MLIVVSYLVYYENSLQNVTILLQNETAILLQNVTKFFYKMSHFLLQNATFIKTCISAAVFRFQCLPHYVNEPDNEVLSHYINEFVCF